MTRSAQTVIRQQTLIIFVIDPWHFLFLALLFLLKDVLGERTYERQTLFSNGQQKVNAANLQSVQKQLNLTYLFFLAENKKICQENEGHI